MIDPREDEVLTGALELDSPATRAAFLDDACEGDAALRARLEARILARLADDAPFAPPATEIRDPAAAPAPAEPLVLGPGGTPAANPLIEGPGDVIDDYQLLEQIGEGGFGAVYVAEQREPVKRRVALKIVKLGMDTREVVARFAAERQALALMDHPNIAKVFDAGATPTGRPYFVMELVRGVPINRFCDEYNFDIRQRLELFAQVCQAIQHAHQKGVIHRDIKPSNVLVTIHDGVAVPKVIDFGIAKATQGALTDQTIYTQFQQFIGTPAYSSPEQAGMTSQDIDTRSDVYSLGVLLYELLTGGTPFDHETLVQGGLEGMRRILCESEPPRPSARLSTLAWEDQSTVAQARQSNPGQLSSLLRGDLDWIVMKALEKDRARRYDTANGFAEDIRRYLNFEPVTARPPSTAYVLRKLVRRHRVAFAAAGAVALALILGLSASTYLYFKEARARKQALNEAKKSELVARFICDMLETLDQRYTPGRDVRLLREILDASAKRLYTVHDHPEVEAQLRSTYGQAYLDLGLSELALPHLEKAAELHRKLNATGDDTRKFMLRLAQVYRENNRPREAEPIYERLLEQYSTVARRTDPVGRGIMHSLALLYHARGELPKARALLTELEGNPVKPAVGENPSSPTLKLDLAAVLADEGKTDAADALYAEALKIWTRTLYSQHPETLRLMVGTALNYHKDGKRRQAETLSLGLVSAVENYPFARPADLRQFTVFVDQLADALRLQGLLPQARATAEQAVTLYGAHREWPLRDALHALDVLANVDKAEAGQIGKSATFWRTNSAILTLGTQSNALPVYEAAYKIYQAQSVPNRTNYLATVRNLTQTYEVMAQRDAATAPDWRRKIAELNRASAGKK
jgi:serine/threonine protein kinase